MIFNPFKMTVKFIFKFANFLNFDDFPNSNGMGGG